MGVAGSDGGRRAFHPAGVAVGCIIPSELHKMNCTIDRTHDKETKR
ncbi:hypothetical protein LuPra_04099 [Luteitalea pratensis]|uniref:Uncharacterized protein n=1 Tax=Luteitalea pratensis TaxID=1855912 RepID=A0A143PR67_LUTPR|nr:hypothetical protein LuPra_04099 [Luteitalea pratensis]